MDENGYILARGHRFKQFGDSLECTLCGQRVDTGDQNDETVPLCPNRSQLFQDNRDNLVALRGSLAKAPTQHAPWYKRIIWANVAIIAIVIVSSVCTITGFLYLAGIIGKCVHG